MSNNILLIDIEITPNVGYTWGKWEQDVIEFVEEWHILSFAYKWLGGATRLIAVPDCGNEKAMLLKLWKLLDQAEIVIAQNGDAFDIKKINTRFIFYKIPPPSPYRTIDTLKIAQGRFAFNSNKLDDLGKVLSEGRKIKHRGFEMWKGCLSGDKKAWRDMKRYNKQDVDLLEKLYLRFLPWIKSHPVTLERHQGQCPRCGSKSLESRGVYYTKTTVYRRFKCKSCHGWTKGNSIEKTTSQTPI